MKLGDLKIRAKTARTFFNSYVKPNELLKELKSEFKYSYDRLPLKLREAFDNYSAAYHQLAAIYPKINRQIDEAEAQGMTDESEIPLSAEIANFVQLQSKFERLYIDLQLVRNQEMADANVVSNDKTTERIVFTDQDVSNSYLARIQEKTQQVLTIINAPFDKTKIDKNLQDMALNPLSLEEDESHLGTNKGYPEDYKRGVCVFESDQKLLDLEKELTTGNFVVDDLEQMVQAYLTWHWLDPKNAPPDAAVKVRALLTTLSYQGGLAGQLYIELKDGFFHYGLNDQGMQEGHFNFEKAVRSNLSSVFFDSQTGKFHFETYLERKYLITDDGVDKEMKEQAQAARLFEKVSMEVSMEVSMDQDPWGNPIFTVGQPKFQLAIVRNKDFANAYYQNPDSMLLE